MSKDRETILKSVVNASGFAFQLGIEHQVERTQEEHRWEVLAREHPWSTDERNGFADLILGYGIVRLVVECKRPRDASWVFLIPRGSIERTHRCRALWTDATSGKPNLLGWDDFGLTPESAESEFCVVRGQGEGDRPLLERISADLMESLPSIAEDELRLARPNSISRHWVYIPVIVTTAKLELCRFAPENVTLSDGLLDLASFETVPFVRFRKSLAHSLNPHSAAHSLGDLTRDKMRTIIVVNSEHLTEFLRQWKMWSVDQWSGELPWTLARRVEAKSQP